MGMAHGVKRIAHGAWSIGLELCDMGENAVDDLYPIRITGYAIL